MSGRFNIVLLALAIVGAGCGGGSSPGPVNVDTNDDTSDNSGGSSALISKANADEVLELGLSTPELLLQLTQTAAAGVDELSGSGKQMLPEMTCSTPVEDYGTRSSSYADNDDSGSLSAGDVVELRYTDCFVPRVGRVTDGVMQLHLTTFSIDRNGVLAFNARAEFVNFATGGTNVVDGDLNIYYRLTFASEVLAVEPVDESGVSLKASDGETTARDFFLSKHFDLPGGDFTVNSEGAYRHDETGLDIECSTVRPLDRDSASVMSGTYHCTAGDGSYVRIYSTVGPVRLQGGSEDNSELYYEIRSDWMDHVSGLLFSAETRALQQTEDVLPEVESTVLAPELAVVDIAYDSDGERLYAANYFGGVSTINPDTGNYLDEDFINHGESGQIALSPDGTRLYYATDSRTIRRYSLPDGVFLDELYETNLIRDIAISPVDPDVFALSVDGGEELVIYNGQTRLTNTLSGEGVEVDTIAFNDGGDTLYAYHGYEALTEISVVADGVDAVGEVVNTGALLPGYFHWEIEFRYEDDGVQFDNGWRIDTESGSIAGLFSPNFEFNGSYDRLLTDDQDHAYGLFDDGRLYKFDLAEMTPLAACQTDIDLGDNGPGLSSIKPDTIHVPGKGILFLKPLPGSPTGSSLNLFEYEKLEERNFTECSSHNLDAPINPKRLKQLRCRLEDAVYDPVSDRIFATVPGWAGRIGNSVLKIDPESAQIQQRVWVGSEPGKMAMAADGSRLYVLLKNQAAVVVLNPSTLNRMDRFDLEANASGRLYSPAGLAVSPVSPTSLVVSGQEMLALYINGVRSPNMDGSFFSAYEYLHFSADGSTLYGVRDLSTRLSIYSVDTSGVSFIGDLPSLIEDSRVAMRGQYLLDAEGNVVHLPTQTTVGSLHDRHHDYTGMHADVGNGHFYTYKQQPDWGAGPSLVRRYDTDTLASTTRIKTPSFLPHQGGFLKIFDIGDDKLGLLWDTHLDIYHKGDFAETE